MSESRTTAALRRCEWPANRGRTGEPLRCRWRRHGSARIGADAEVGSARRAKFPRNLPVPSSLGTSRYPVGCPMCTVPDKRGWLPQDAGAPRTISLAGQKQPSRGAGTTIGKETEP
jgi:hypothetical protein